MLDSVVIGFSIAAPVGPIGVLCIRNTLNYGWRAGLVSGMGAASADGFYGAIAALGISALTSLLTSLSLPIRIFGIIMLVYIGWTTLRSRPADNAAKVERRDTRLLSFYGATFLLTLSNPMTIIAFLGIFAGIGASTANTGTSALVMVLGVFIGSALWWLLLAGGVSLLRERLSSNLLLWVNRLSGVIILLFALSIAWGVLSGSA